MAVVVDGWGVVARRAEVEAKLPDGVAGWVEVVPNRMACVDRDLCFVAFMAHEDAMAFVAKLDGMGLGGERDVAVVDKDGVWAHACTWLRFGRYGGVNAVWMEGSDPEPLVVPAGWRPNSIVNLSAEEAAKRLTFVRRDGDVEVYVDTETGQEMYRARTGPSYRMDPEIEERLQAVVESIKPLITFDDKPRQLGFFEKRRLEKGIRELEALAADDRWRVWWFIGIARRCVGLHVRAVEAFERAYVANPTDAEVARALGSQCLRLGRGERAVELSEETCKLHPRDAGLRANLALSCVIAGDMRRAKVEVARALEMDPEDEITRALAVMIDEVIAGRRPRLTKYP